MIEKVENVSVWSRTCDTEYPLPLVSATISPPIAKHRIVPFPLFDASDGQLEVIPINVGSATLSMIYAWQGGTRTFETSIEVVSAVVPADDSGGTVILNSSPH